MASMIDWVRAPVPVAAIVTTGAEMAAMAVTDDSGCTQTRTRQMKTTFRNAMLRAIRTRRRSCVGLVEWPSSMSLPVSTGLWSQPYC